jgi:nitroimidazol reductase NimA-like FMN-containing flavoprotein (pyridoxamine 5'-phosphate oxidase superfamily)
MLLSSRVGYLGLVDGDVPYVVPLNFLWHRNRDAIYIHGAQDGRKASLMSIQPKATFTVSQELGTMANPIPAKTDTAYTSVMVFGRISLIEDLDEKTEILEAMLAKYVPGYYSRPLSPQHVMSYISNAKSSVRVWALSADQITAKRHEESMSTLFYPGRTQVQDVLQQTKGNA